MNVRILLAPLAVLLLASRPDEGQWLPQQVREMDWDKLKARGMQLTKDEFWHPERGGVLSAAVQINGCSASFVSADGLVLTNHHCGFDAIGRVSTTSDNYLRDGFVAASREQEIPAPGMTVAVVRRIDDVTAQIHAQAAKATNDLERHDLVQAEIARLVAEGQKQPNTVCSVASFLEGREYHLYHRTQLTDVRLVYSPPRSIGEYGGDVDNWEWPRHTGDFAFFRAYAAPDGSPRRHSKDNVPFRPEHFLKLSTDGVVEGDLVVVMGYPGRTERYLSSDAVLARQLFFWPTRQRLYEQILRVLGDASNTSPEKALALAPRIKRLANVEKAARGQVKGLTETAVHARKLREEDAFTTWVEQDPERRKQYGDVLAELRALDARARETEARDLMLSELYGQTTLLRVLVDIASAAMAAEAAGHEGNGLAITPQGRRLIGSATLTADFELVEKPILTILVDALRAGGEGERPHGVEVLLPDGKSSAEAIDAVFGASPLMTASGRNKLIDGGRSAVLTGDDPLLVLARGLAKERAEMTIRQRTAAGQRLVIGPRWIEAQQKWRGTSFYPDANSTLRVAIASVKGYSPRDGVLNLPRTTIAGALAKATGEEPFALPDAFLGAVGKRAESRYFDKSIGDVPVCFLMDGDTTGGNSGSPVIDGRGRLVGLNFDRVFEAVAGDYGWSPERSRNICVDVRFILWFVTAAMPSPTLAAELGA